mgnify:FL=1
MDLSWILYVMDFVSFITGINHFKKSGTVPKNHFALFPESKIINFPNASLYVLQ